METIEVLARQKKQYGERLVSIYLPIDIAKELPLGWEYTSKLPFLPSEIRDKYRLIHSP